MSLKLVQFYKVKRPISKVNLISNKKKETCCKLSRNEQNERFSLNYYFLIYKINIFLAIKCNHFNDYIFIKIIRGKLLENNNNNKN